MRSKSPFAVLAPFVFSVIVFAQASQMPQPAPELKKLDYFAGTWKTDADVRASQFGPGGKMTSTDRIEWMQGNYFLLVHSAFSGGMGSGTELAIMGFDPAKKVYTYSSYNSAGEHESATGTLEGDTWTWNSSGGMKWRYTEKVLSPTSYTMKFEMSPDDTTWSTLMEGKATKQ